jgi:O-antigen ligase
MKEIIKKIATSIKKHKRCSILIGFGLLLFCLCAGSLFIQSSLFVNDRTTPKWYWTIFCSLVILFLSIVLSVFSSKGWSFRILTSWFCGIIASLCFLQASYGILQYFNIAPVSAGFPITGSFDNPAGFAACLCAGFLFVFYFVLKGKSWKRYLSMTAGIILVVAVALSASRAGIISIIVVCLAVFFYKIKIAVKWKWTITIALLFVSLSGLYFLKKDSADGRLLIWRCCLEMIKDKPLFGHGSGGFKANYMNYQAKYFDEHPDSEYVMLADNVNCPFNEYLLLLVNFGVFGLMVLILILYRLWQIYKYNRRKTCLDYAAYGCLLSIAVFALFSYPLTYPFVWMMGLSSLTILFYPLGRTQKRFFFMLRPLIILSVPLAGYLTYNRMRAEMRWCDIAHQSLRGQTKQMLPEYQSLYNKLKTNELFLYNYTAELNVAGQYENSLTIAQECERLWADYDLQMLIADNYLHLKQYSEAEAHYKKAAAMCPVKFMPLYELTKMYTEKGRDDEALVLANTILAKKVKVPSATLFAIKKEMHKLINNIKDKHKILKERQDKVSSEESIETVLPP